MSTSHDGRRHQPTPASFSGTNHKHYHVAVAMLSITRRHAYIHADTYAEHITEIGLSHRMRAAAKLYCIVTGHRLVGIRTLYFVRSTNTVHANTCLVSTEVHTYLSLPKKKGKHNEGGKTRRVAFFWLSTRPSVACFMLVL